MKLTELTLKNRTVIIILTVILIVAGAYSYVTIPKESQPSIEIPIFIVNTIYPGISPTDMESLITQPIERELQGLSGVKEIRSTTTESVSSVVIEFDLDVSIDLASQKVRERVDLAKSSLPPEAEDPIIIEIDIEDLPIVTVNLAAEYPISTLTDVAESLQDQIETVPGIREVELVGTIEREVQLDVDLKRLEGYGLSFGQIINALQTRNLTIPGGTVDVERLNYLVRVSGEFDHPREIENVVVARPMGEKAGPGLVYMKDVADVQFGFQERESYARLRAYKVDENGGLTDLPDEQIRDNQVISLNIKKRPGVNILDTVEGVVDVVEGFTVPAGTSVIITGDTSEDVRKLVSDLENSIISGMLFVVLVLVFFLGLRNALLVGAAVPISIFVGFIVLGVLGYSANFVILFSLIIALGLLVDNSIVVVENIYRYREMGYSRFEAAKLATDEVGYALIAATATLLAAFIPMTFWPGIIGQFMGYLPLTLIIVLLSSLFVALVLYPVLTGYLVRLDHEEKPERSTLVKGILWGGLLFLLIAIGAANAITLVVTLLTIVFFYLTFRFFVQPSSAYFTGVLIPRVLVYYKAMLRNFLKRDYSVKHALLRNTLSLGSLTLALILAILGGLVSLFSPAGSFLLLLAGIAGGAGALGVLIHTIETIFLGRMISVKTGLYVLAFIVILLGSLSFFREIDLQTWIVILSAPSFIILVGLMGMLRRSRKPLLLTDNRSMMLNTVMGTFFAIFMLFGGAPTGVEFFPSTDPNRINIDLEGPIGMNIEESNRIAQDVQTRLYALIDQDDAVRDNIENIQTNVGVGGDPLSGGAIGASPERSRLTLNLIEFGDRKESSSVTMTKIRDVVRDIPDILIKIEGEEQGPPTGAPVNIEVSGQDFDEIVRISREVTQLLREASVSQAVPGLVDVKNNVSGGLPEYRIEVDYEKASRLGLSMLDVAQTVRIANNGLETGKWRDGEDEYDIVLRLRPEDRRELESLRNLTIRNPMGAAVPLSAIATFTEDVVLGSITRVDLQRTATIEGQAAPGFSGPEVFAAAQEFLKEYEATLPNGYRMSYTGENEEQAEAFGFLSVALLIGFSLIFLIMLAKFNNVISPLIIMTAVGLSLIGVLLGLILTRTPFGLMTFIGVISLAGIVCVNNVVLLDYVKQLTEKGLAKRHAILEAGLIRFRPVLLTAATTILGLVPLTFGINIDFVNLFVNFDPNFQLGSESTAFWGPMGTAIISGLTFATFLTLVVVPVLYSAFESLAARISRA